MSNPDMAARAQRLGRKTGLPGDVVERNLPEVERSAALTDRQTARSRVAPAGSVDGRPEERPRFARRRAPDGAIEAAVKWLVSAPGRLVED